MRSIVRTASLFLVIFMLSFAGGASADDDAAYGKALAFLQNGQHAEAFDQFSQLMQSSGGNVKYQSGRLAALIELAKEDKERKSDAWKGKSEEAAITIKQMYRLRIAAPEFYLASSRYYALIERERHIEWSLQKASSFRADPAEVEIARGDAYFWLARMTDPGATADSAATGSSSSGAYVRQYKAASAKESYEAALKSPGLSPARAAYVYFTLAEIERSILLNSVPMTGYLKKAVEIAPDSFWGKKAAGVLRTAQ